MLKSITAAFGALALCASAAQADVEANKQLVMDMVENVFVARDVAAVETYFTESYIQHNPMLPSGSATIVAFLSMPEDPEAEDVTPNVTHRMIGDGDLVATHSTYYNFGETPLVAFDIFRIEDGRIAEHWDNLEPLREGTNPAGRTQTDGATEVTDHALTEDNRALVVELLERMFIGGEQLDITQYINPAQYLQHNPDAGDGLQGLQELMARNAAEGRAMRYEELAIVVAEGNFVLTGSSGFFGRSTYGLLRFVAG